MEFVFLKLLNLFLIILSANICYSEICQSCICEEQQAECYLGSCEDVLVDRISIDIMTIHGFLCAEHRNQLSSDHYANTIVLLTDDICGDVPNCR